MKVVQMVEMLADKMVSSTAASMVVRMAVQMVE